MCRQKATTNGQFYTHAISFFYLKNKKAVSLRLKSNLLRFF